MVLGDVCSPALGLLVPECNVALALWTVLCSWLSHGSTTSASFHIHACVCISVRVCACACVCMYTGDHPPRIFLENTSLRLQSEVKLILAIILHLSPAIQLTLCVHPSMHVSVSLWSTHSRGESIGAPPPSPEKIGILYWSYTRYFRFSL